MDITGMQLPPPTEWQAFERLMRRLFALEFACPHTYMAGRSGQDQGGLDIIGRRGDGTHFGIQCKLKDKLAANTKLGRAALRVEVEAARASFKPKLGEFILATTASDDIDLQEYARELTEEFAPDGPAVYVYGWHQLRAMIGNHPELLRAFLGGAADVAAITDQIVANHEQVTDQLARIAAGLQAATQISAMELKSDDPRFTRAIKRIKARQERGEVREALRELEELRNDEWDSASASQRFMILSNLGAAHWKLREFELATPLFIEASRLCPDDEKGLANAAAVTALSGDADGARKIALRLLAINSQTETGLLALVQAQEYLEPLPDPLDALPADRRECEEALIGAIQVYRGRGDERWLAITDDAAARYTESALLTRMKAEAVLHRLALCDGAHVGAHHPGRPTVEEINWAAAALEAQWKDDLGCDPTQVDTSLAQNLAQLFRAQGRDEEALSVLDRSTGSDDPDSDRTIHLHAVLLMMAGRKAEAISKLREGLGNFSNRLLASQLLEDEPAEAMRLLGEVDWSDAEPEQQMWRSVLSIEARAALEPDYDGRGDLEAISDDHPHRLIPWLALAKMTTATEDRAEVAEALGAHSSDRTPFSDVLQAVNWLRNVNLPSHIIALLRDRIALDQDCQALRWLIEALIEVDDRSGLVAVFELLPPDIADLPRYLHYRVVAYFNIGDLPNARGAADRFIQLKPFDICARMSWVQILMRQHDRGPIEAWLETPIEELDGPVEELAELGLLLGNFGHFERARRFGYRLARRFPDSKIAQERFVGIMFGKHSEDRTVLGMNRVGPDSVFMVSEPGGGTREYRLDSETDLPRESIDLMPDARIAIAAAGHTAGDTIEIPATFAGAPVQILKITQVKHCHLHYLHMLLETLPERFPGPAMFQKFTIDPESENPLRMLQGVVQEMSEQAGDSLEAYESNALPLRVVARMNGSDVIDAYDGLHEQGGAGFICSAGAGPEFAREKSAILGNQGHGCIIDALTLEIVRRYDLFDIVEEVVGGFGATQGTIDSFSNRVIKMEAAGGEQRGNLGHRDGKMIATAVYPAQIEAARTTLHEVQDWAIGHTTIVTSIGPPGLASELRGMLPGEIGAQFRDDILAAAQTGLLLLSDDLGYRRLAGAAGVTRTAGLAAVLSLAHEGEIIDHRVYVEKLSALARAGHTFMSISAADLREAFDADHGTPGDTVKGLIRLLGGQDVDLPGHVLVACTFLDAVWDMAGVERHRLELIGLIADRLFESQPRARKRCSELLFQNPETGVQALREAATLVENEHKGE